MQEDKAKALVLQQNAGIGARFHPESLRPSYLDPYFGGSRGVTATHWRILGSGTGRTREGVCV